MLWQLVRIMGKLAQSPCRKAYFLCVYWEVVMKRTFVSAVLIGLCFMLNGFVGAEEKSADAIASGHMVAEAMLTAHFIDAALKAGMSTDAINAVLAKVAERTVISEFWISDEAGRIVFSNIQGAEFAFPTDPDAGTQAAPFATLLSRRRDGCRPRSSAARTGCRAIQVRRRCRGRPVPASSRWAYPAPRWKSAERPDRQEHRQAVDAGLTLRPCSGGEA